MDDLIKRQPILDSYKRICDICGNDKKYGGAICGACYLGDAISIVEDAPSAQKKGQWNFVGDNLFKCTCCGEMYTTQQLNGLRVYDKDPYCPFFCPHCGADMRKEGEENG